MNRCTVRSTIALALIGAGALTLALPPAPARAEGWRYSFTPYGWATDIGIDSELDGRTVIDKTIPVNDIVKDIDAIFQARFEATHGPLGVMIDVFDVTMSMEKYGVALPQSAGYGDFETEIGMTIADLALTYAPGPQGRGLGFLAGTRIINDRADIDARFTPTGGSAVAQHYDSDETLVDGLVGMRFRTKFGRNWSLETAADFSTGGTDWTWSAGPTLSYAFGRNGRFGVNAGYRRMDIDFKDEGGMDNRLSLSGPLVGFRTSF